jgi:hypothetical protein
MDQYARQYRPKLLAAMSPVSYVTLDPNQQHRPVGIVVKRQPSIG